MLVVSIALAKKASLERISLKRVEMQLNQSYLLRLDKAKSFYREVLNSAGVAEWLSRWPRDQNRNARG